jgi:polyisoprenyl-teichoic acid--peptidoglycan teichoic acid transferase
VEVRKVDNARRRPRSLAPEVARRKPVKKHRRTSWLWLCLASVGLISAGGGAMLALSLSGTPLLRRELSLAEAAIFRRDNSFSRGALQVPEVSKPVNILLLGIKTNASDMRNGTGNERKEAGYDKEIDSLQGLSDTMMLLRFDPVSKRMVVLSVQRDTKVEYNGRSMKINAIDQEGGVAQSVKVVKNTLAGVEIDRYVRMNNFGVEKIINALGGLTVVVPKDIKYQDDSQHFYINLKAGKQHLDGEKLLGFMRFRKDANGDVGRMQRQQVVMKAMIEQWVNPITVARIPQLMSIVKSHVDTNLTVEEIIALGGFAANHGKGKVQTLMLPGDYNGDGRHGTSYWLVNEEATKNMMAQYFDHGEVDNTPIPPAKLRIKVIDTGYFPDATQRFMKRLDKEGFRRSTLDKEPKQLKENLETTKIIVQHGGTVNGDVIKQALGFGEVEVGTSGDIYSDITIKLGKDWAQRK